MAFADNYVAALTGAYDALAAKAVTPDAKRAAAARKLATVRAAYTNAVNPNPRAGLVELIVLASLERQSADDPWFKELFGSAGEPVRGALARGEAGGWALAERYLTARHQEELRAAIAHWRRENPDQTRVAGVRLFDLPDAREAQAAGRAKPGSIFDVLFIDPLAGVEPAAREIEMTRATASRMFFYLQRMPEMVRWETELLYSDMLLAPELQSTVRDLSTFTANTTRFTDACKEVSAAVGRFAGELSVEREKAIVQLDQAVGRQRDAAIKDVAKATAIERDAALKQIQGIVQKEREQIIETGVSSISREREAAVRQVADTVRTEQGVIVADFESAVGRLIDRAAWRLGTALAISGAIIAVVAMVCRRLSPGNATRIRT